MKKIIIKTILVIMLVLSIVATSYAQLNDPGVPSATTEYIPNVQKMSEVDNVRPKIEMEGLIQEATTEVWLIEAGGTPFTSAQIEQLINELKSNRITAVVYLVKRDGNVEQYITNSSGTLQKIN